MLQSLLRRQLNRLRMIYNVFGRFGPGRALQLIRYHLSNTGSARRARLTAFHVARRVTFNRAVDVTELWNRTHPHLVPLEQEPGFLSGEFVRCPSCGNERAVRLLAHVRLGPRGWTAMRAILSCYSCHRYNLPFHELLWPWAKQILTLQSLEPTRIDARLWTDATQLLNIEPTTYCNFDCWYCVGRHMKQAHLTYENFVKVIDGSPSLKHLSLVGEGEPMLNKRFFDMVGYAKARGIRVGIVSNGSIFSRSIVKKICDSELDYIQISIDSSDPKRFAETRVGGDLEKIWDGIERLTSYRNERGLTHPVLVVRGTALASTQHDIPEIVREAKKRGVDAIGPWQTLNRKESYVAIYPEDEKRHLKNVEEVGKSIFQHRLEAELPFINDFVLEDLGMGDRPLEIWPNRLRQSCDIPTTYSLLSGDVTPCCQIKTPTAPTCNLAEHGMESVMRDEKYENMRFNLWNGLYLKNCESCRGYTRAGFAKRHPPLPR